MNQLHLLHDIEVWLVNLVFVISVLFPIVTRFYWNWMASEWGKNIIALEVSIAATLVASVLYLDLGVNSLVLRWVSDISLAMVGCVIVWRAVLIWHTQRNEGNDMLAGQKPQRRRNAP